MTETISNLIGANLLGVFNKRDGHRRASAIESSYAPDVAGRTPHRAVSRRDHHHADSAAAAVPWRIAWPGLRQLLCDTGWFAAERGIWAAARKSDPRCHSEPSKSMMALGALSQIMVKLIPLRQNQIRSQIASDLLGNSQRFAASRSLGGGTQHLPIRPSWTNP